MRTWTRLRSGWRRLRRLGADLAYGIDAGHAIRHGGAPAPRGCRTL
ncbi:hypothetical protein [Streptomyces carpaticus]